MGIMWTKTAYHLAVARMHQEACVLALEEAKAAVERTLPDDIEQARHYAVSRAFRLNVAVLHAELHKKHSDLAHAADYEKTEHTLHVLKLGIEHGASSSKNVREVDRLMERFQPNEDRSDLERACG